MLNFIVLILLWVCLMFLFCLALCRRSPVSLWLSSMRLEGLSNVLESHGFDDMDFMVS